MPEDAQMPGLIQQQQQAFALNALKAEVHVAGEPVDGIAVQGAVGNLRETGNELVPQRGRPWRRFRRCDRRPPSTRRPSP